MTRTTPVRRALVAVAALALGASLTACSGGSGAAGGRDGSEPSTAPSAAPAASIELPAAGEVRPDAPVAVSVRHGTLTSVEVRPEGGGSPVEGALAEGGGSWTARGGLKPGTTYTVTAAATGEDGTPAERSASFTTVKPARTVTASVLPRDGWTVGVGMPVVVDFSRAVADRDAAEAALSVTSVPAVEGAWRWISAKQVQWRPREFWPAGTAVTVRTALTGVEVAPGTWGKSSSTTEFAVGSAMVTTVDVAKHTMTVRKDGRVLRTIPVTTGKRGFASRNGTKVVMSRESSRRMDAATTGTDPGDPEYYDIDVEYAMRLTWSGEFLHAAPWSVGSQGRANVSHGCTGMSTANAKWMFERSKVGDVVRFTGSTRGLEWGNGYTAWNMSYDRWSAA